MLRICVVGWYGTETMGDRAILDGILSVFYNISEKIELHLGSLYPIYTERTIQEEGDVFNYSCPGFKVIIFNIKDKAQVDEEIKKTDIVIFGGGPIMDIAELLLPLYCFQNAKKRGIPTIIMGCGIGPLCNAQNLENIKKLFRCSDLISTRDYFSANEAYKLKLCDNDIQCLGDPAAISVENYKRRTGVKIPAKSTVCVNFRRFPYNEYKRTVFFDKEIAWQILEELTDFYDEIVLVPMHSFAVGGDDRAYFAEVMVGRANEKIIVRNVPQNLWGLYDDFALATACVGMRYHSVLMQTLLNGNNYILNYTKEAGNKIDGFLNFYSLEEIYQKRVWDMESNYIRLSVKCLKERMDVNIRDDGLVKYRKAVMSILK